MVVNDIVVPSIYATTGKSKRRSARADREYCLVRDVFVWVSSESSNYSVATTSEIHPADVQRARGCLQGSRARYETEIKERPAFAERIALPYLTLVERRRSIERPSTLLAFIREDREESSFNSPSILLSCFVPLSLSRRFHGIAIMERKFAASRAEQPRRDFAHGREDIFKRARVSCYSRITPDPE